MAGVEATGIEDFPGERGQAETRDGITIAYERWHAPHPHARVALLHPLALDSTFWRPVAARMNGAAEIIALDCRGHGSSDKPEGPYSVEQFAADLADVMDEIGWETAIVGGASLGGCMALAFAAAHGNRLDALALMDTTAWFGPGAAEAWAIRADKAIASGMRSLVDFHRLRWFSDAFIRSNPETVDTVMGVFAANDVDAYREACLMLGNCDLRAILEDFEVPVSIIVGREDFATPIAMAAALRDGIPGATLEIIEGARHLAALEAPDLAAAKLRALIKQVEAG